jgi:Fic family protein
MEPRVILHLHALAQGGHAGDAGKWKRRNNEIIEMLPGGKKIVRFIPTPAKETPGMIGTMCVNYRKACEENRAPVLLITAAFILDFLCIHPFRDGNGRVSRLLTALLLQEHGFMVSRYISLEHAIEENRERYYSSLYQSSQGWHEGSNNQIPWWNFFLGILSGAYREFAQRVESSSGLPAKGEIVRQVIESQVGYYTLADLRAQLPAVSVQLIKKTLSELKKAGKVRLEGHGRGARWENV